MYLYSYLEEHLSQTWQATALVFIVLIAGGLLVRSRLATAEGGALPDEGVSVRNLFEVLVEGLAEQAQAIIGDNYRTYFPIIGALFFFILLGNVSGLVPGLGDGTTGDVNTALAWATISFLTYNVVGIRQHGWKYIYQFMGPALMNLEIGGTHFHVRVLAPIFLPLEIVLHLARIITLTVRLIANMFADHALVMAWLKLVPVVLPAVFMGLGLFVAFLQAFVFALLTMIYIGQALEEPH
ncbi:MAG: F0F1 ATP synthase subunit A [Myxococcota bacterium]|nr:F0F1 ATP synthase subunit A [Myxococcota bacterium]